MDFGFFIFLKNPPPAEIKKTALLLQASHPSARETIRCAIYGTFTHRLGANKQKGCSCWEYLRKEILFYFWMEFEIPNSKFGIGIP